MRFCDICAREILCDDELGKIDNRRHNLAGNRHTTTTTYCKDCVEDEEEVMIKYSNSPEAEAEILFNQIAEQEKRTHELANKIDRETSSEERRVNMIKRTLKLREGE